MSGTLDRLEALAADMAERAAFGLRIGAEGMDSISAENYARYLAETADALPALIAVARAAAAYLAEMDADSMSTDDALRAALAALEQP